MQQIVLRDGGFQLLKVGCVCKLFNFFSPVAGLSSVLKFCSKVFIITTVLTFFLRLCDLPYFELVDYLVWIVLSSGLSDKSFNPLRIALGSPRIWSNSLQVILFASRTYFAMATTAIKLMCLFLAILLYVLWPPF